MRLQSLRLDATRYRLDVAVVAVGIAYMLVTGWAMVNMEYETWGALVAIPFIVAVMVPTIHHAFRDHVAIARIAYVGLAAKVLGTFARYWVAFDAYGGAADAQAYHDLGSIYAGQIRSGDVPPWTIVPTGQGTEFIQHLTGTIYTFVGSSKLAGFMWFSAIGFGGVLLCIKAAIIAVPTLSHTRYALLCCLSPSLVFWPSSIGKEAWMSLVLGALCYGTARLFAGRGLLRPLLWTTAGAVGALLVRPHIAAVWVGAAVAAAAWSVIGSRTDRSTGRSTNVALMVVGLAGLTAVARVAIKFLGDLSRTEGTESVSSQLNNAFDLTLKRTAGGGSEFVPPSVASPLDYPLAVLRTLTRPLLNEVTGLSTLLPALETTAIIILAVVGVRRLMSLPGMLRRSPFTVFHVLIVVLGALAYSSFSNLAILVRQRSLLMPSLLFILCLPLYFTPNRPGPSSQAQGLDQASQHGRAARVNA